MISDLYDLILLFKGDFKMIFCPNCGTQLSDTATFCGQCGKALPMRAASAAPVQDQAPAPAPVQQTVNPQPVSQPQYQQAVSQPQYQQPVQAQPAYQQPVYQQPVQSVVQPVVQPVVTPVVTPVQPQVQPVYVQPTVIQKEVVRPQSNGQSPMGIIAFVLCFVPPVVWAPLSFFLALLDLIIHQRSRKHGLAVAALILSIIGGIFWVIGVIALANGGWSDFVEWNF